MSLIGRKKKIKGFTESEQDVMKILAVPDANTGKMCVLTVLPKRVCKDGYIFMEAESFKKYFKELEAVNKTLDMNDA